MRKLLKVLVVAGTVVMSANSIAAYTDGNKLVQFMRAYEREDIVFAVWRGTILSICRWSCLRLCAQLLVSGGQQGGFWTNNKRSLKVATSLRRGNINTAHREGDNGT
jgi:hypothetical protein